MKLFKLFLITLLSVVVGVAKAITVNVSLNPSANGTFSGESSAVSGYYTTWTSNAASGLAGVVITTGGNLAMCQQNVNVSGYGNLLALKTSTSNSAENIVIKAPEGYVIIGYELTARLYSSSTDAYTIRETTIVVGGNNIREFNLSASELTLTAQDTKGLSKNYLCITAFKVHLEKPISSLDALATGWYRIRCVASTGSYKGYLKNVSPETIYNTNLNYPIGIQASPAAVDAGDGTYYFYLTKTQYGHYIQVANGHFVNNAQPTSALAGYSCKIGYDEGGFYLYSSSSNSKYFVPYAINGVPSVGESTQNWAASVRYEFHPVNLEDEGVAKWVVSIEDGMTESSPLSGNTQVICSNAAVKGLTMVYNNGYFFLPTGTVPSSSDFSIGNSTDEWKFVVNSTAKTITAQKVAANELTSLSQLTTGWYQIAFSAPAADAGRYWYNTATDWQRSAGECYAVYGQATASKPESNDPAYYIRVEKSGSNYYVRSANGHYLDTQAKTTTSPTPISVTYDDATGAFKFGNYWKYYSSISNIIGWTSVNPSTREQVFSIDPADEGLDAWQVVLNNFPENTQLTCNNAQVKGNVKAYNGGYFFFATDEVIAVSDFAVDGVDADLYEATIDAESKTITVTVPMLTISSPMAEASFTWNGITKTGKTVTFSYTGGTISDNTITVSYTGNEFTSATLSQATWDGTSNLTVTCTMTPAFFSTSYGEKWVRIASARNVSVVMGLSSGISGEGLKQKAKDYFDEGQLWCLVGNMSSFKMYNKKSGNTLQLASANTTIGNGVGVNMAAVDAAGTDWKIFENFSATNPGWGICYANKEGTSFSLNVWSGATAGNDIKYYQTPDVGDQWVIEDASGEVSLALSGLDTETMTVYTQNIANLPITIGSSTSQTLLTKDNFVTKTAYVPNNSELTFGAPAMFMNYGFTGYDGSEQTKTVTSSTTPRTITATFSVVRPDARYLWEPLRIYNGEGEKDYYRIPAIVTAKNGDILAINDRRWNNDTDLGNNSGTAANPVNHHIDIIGVASSDNGNTWSNEFMIMDGTGLGALAGYGDAAVVADRENNKVLVMACAGNVFYTGQNNSYHQTIQRTILTHNGTSWVAEAPTDVTNQFYAGSLASSDGMFIGSGAISQSKIIKKGDYYRIYCTVLERSSSNFVFYSDDFGLTWTMMGSTAPAHDNEPKVDELPDGSVLLSVRKSYGRTFNVWTWDDNTYTTGSWGTAVASNNQAGGISFGNNSTNGDIRMIPAIKKSTGEVVTLAMQSVPTANSRAEVSLYYKELDPSVTYTPTTIAQNWSSRFLITPHSSAYSSFNPQPDGRIAFYMEEAPKSATGFYMCYVPLTLDEITDNQYTGVPATYPVTLNTVGSASYATLYLPFDVTTDANTKAYVIKEVGDGSAKMTELTGGEIAARTAVVLVNETSNSATFSIASGLSPQVTESENLLKGTLVGRELDLGDGTPYYSMGKIDDKIGFYKFNNNGTTTITLGANKAYLDTTTPAGNVKGFTLGFGGEDGISKIVNSTSVNGTWYDLNGRRLSGAPAAKGVYIVGGKKVVVK